MTSTLPQANSARGSSVTYFKGESLNVIESLDGFVEDFDDVMDDVLQSVTDQVRDELREVARQDVQWREYADMIDVVYEDGELHFLFVDDDPARIDAAMELEYGGPDVPVNSLLRKYGASHESEHQEMLMGELVEALDV